MSPALQYLMQRRFTRSTIIDWQLGYCPEWKLVTPKAIANNLLSAAQKAGIVKTDDEGKSYDVLHHRLTIPIHNEQGNLIGFGGRLLPKQLLTNNQPINGGKYINPTTTPLYDKSNTLFGLHKAIKNFKAHGMGCLVEGYLDVIKLHQHGWNNTIATCGTALTEGQAKKLKRFTDTVLILRDGDQAGRAAIEKDIPILAAQQFTVYMCQLPDGADPDTLFTPSDTTPCENIIRVQTVLAAYRDGIEWLAEKYLSEAQSTSAKATALEKVVKLLSLITNTTRRDEYIKSISKIGKLKAAELAKPLERFFKDAEKEKKAIEADSLEEDKLPAWVSKSDLFSFGFAQLSEPTNTHTVGTYALEGKLTRITNFTIKPLYHIFEQTNNRRLVQVTNGDRDAVVELPNNALVTQSIFETELLNKGPFMTMHNFSKKNFKQLTYWLSLKMPMAYELNTLGWQPEGFFAYSNAVVHNGEVKDYDEMGMISIAGKNYMSLGNSKVNADEREDGNPYENDLFLKYTPPPIKNLTFSQWSNLFCTAYSDHAPYGIAFSFLTIFKDLVTRVAKMPMLYCYGQKGSGKSSMAESITWLFFSGKNAEGDLIKGFNLNPGQSTPFSFFNRVQRFRNCPILLNEFDENIIEDWKFGTLKAAYDGEGREVGHGASGKKKDTKIQKVQGTVIIIGQYLSTRDDGSVASRAIPCQFNLERMKALTVDQLKAYETLRGHEATGISYLVTELMKLRPYVQQNLATVFAAVQMKLIEQTRAAGQRIEARLLSNYSLWVAATKIMIDCEIQLPYTYEHFYEAAKARMVSHNRMLKDNNIVNQFWKGVEVLFDTGKLQSGREFFIKYVPTTGIDIKEDGNVKKKTFTNTTRCLIVRFSNLYASYAEFHRQRVGTPAQGEETFLMYLKEQTYFIGLTPVEQFSDKRTSAYVFNYDEMETFGIVLDKNPSEPDTKPTPF